MIGRRILLVAPIAPPSTMSAARRVAGLSKYLPRHGHEVTLLTSLVSGSGPVEGAVRTIRTRDLMVSPLNWRRANFEAIAGSRASNYDASPSVVASLVVPDVELIGWLPFSLAHAVSLSRMRAVDCVITSSPPHSCHLIGLALHRMGTPWIADFRDGWTYEPTRPTFPSPLQRALDRRLEQVVARNADVVTAVTEPIADDLRNRWGANTKVVTNGFDPEEMPSPPPGWDPPTDPSRRSIVYTGSLGFGGNSPDQALAALRTLAQDHPDSAKRLELVFAGPTTPLEREEIASLEPLARCVGSLPRAETLALQRHSDALLLFAGDHRPSVATGKLYEYLASGRPVIVLGDRSVAAKIVRETGTGVAISTQDVQATVRAFLDIVEGRLCSRPDKHALNRYALPTVSADMSAAVAEAVQRRARPAQRHR